MAADVVCCRCVLLFCAVAVFVAVAVAVCWCSLCVVIVVVVRCCRVSCVVCYFEELAAVC